MKQTRNRITSHQTNCLECNRHFDAEFLRDVMYDQNKLSVNLLCYCGTRQRIIENVNGWIVFRRYIKKKDRVKREAK